MVRNTKINCSYVLLCRHGRHLNGTLIGNTVDGRLEYPSISVGSRLREELERDPAGRNKVTISKVWHADTPEARSTAELLFAAGFASATGTSDPTSDPTLEVCQGLTSKPDQTLAELKELASSLGNACQDGSAEGTANQNRSAILLVGHQPQLSRLADLLLIGNRPKWLVPRTATPIDHSGIVCIATEQLRSNWQNKMLSNVRASSWICWAISYDDAAAADAVREKIGRKMDAAKVFGGLLTLALTLIFGVVLDETKLRAVAERQWAVQASAAIYLVAAVLFLSAMYAYDSLLMPQRFWGETPAGPATHQHRRRWLVERPPSSAAWVLYQNMMRVWNLRFTSASVLVGIATIFLGFAALRINSLVLICAASLGIPILAWWMWRTRPLLGSND